MQINIAILTYNALEFTRRCLISIAGHTTIPHHVFILDNASTDETPSWLTAQTAQNLHVTLSRINLGVPAGRNFLLRQIMPHLSDEGFIIFLDNDVEVEANWYEPYLKLFATHPRAGIAGATGHSIIVHTDWRELLPSPVGEPAPVDVVSGFCFWLLPEAMHNVGYFDERLGLFWHEDDDYCIRAMSLGYEVFAVPETAIVHYSHKSGVAEAGIQLGGSPENQRYLVNKWRGLGLVGADRRIIGGR